MQQKVQLCDTNLKTTGLCICLFTLELMELAKRRTEKMKRLKIMIMMWTISRNYILGPTPGYVVLILSPFAAMLQPRNTDRFLQPRKQLIILMVKICFQEKVNLFSAQSLKKVREIYSFWSIFVKIETFLCAYIRVNFEQFKMLPLSSKISSPVLRNH